MAHTRATERGYSEIVAIIEEEEQRRRAWLIGEKTGANMTAVLAQDELTEAIREGAEARVIAMLESEPALIGRCGHERMVAWLLEHGAEVNGLGPGSRTPSEMSARTRWWKADVQSGIDVAKLLLGRSSDPAGGTGRRTLGGAFSIGRKNGREHG